LTDALAAFFWLAFLALVGCAEMLSWRVYFPWCIASACLASLETNIAYVSRRFTLIESEAFERGLRAGAKSGNVVDLRQHV
jgi:hypothetical protein